MPWHVLLTLSVLVICGRMSAVQASAPVGPLSSARLIAASAPVDGTWTIGVVITLQPGAITYWRDPGEAGVPPSFDFGGSTNISRAEVNYPVPKVIREADIDAIGYNAEVVFLVQLTLAERSAGTAVRLKLDYATCERICLPAHADLALTLPPKADEIASEQLARAASLVPRPVNLNEAKGLVDVARDQAASQLSWTIVPKVATPETQLFVEAPQGFFLTTKRDGAAFRVTVAEHPPGQAVPPSLRVTLAQPGAAVEFALPTE